MEGQVRVGPRLCRGRVPGPQGAWPPPGGCWRNLSGLCSCSTSWAPKASPYSFGVRCMRQADGLRWWRVLRGRALSGCTRGSSWARSARPGSLWLTAGSAAVGLTPLVGSSGERTCSTGRRIVSDGRCGIRVVCAPPCVLAAVLVARCGRQGTRVPHRVWQCGPACS